LLLQCSQLTVTAIRDAVVLLIIQPWWINANGHQERFVYLLWHCARHELAKCGQASTLASENWEW